MLREGGTIKHISFYTSLIQSMGYDPQCALLEIRLLYDGKIRQYQDVPEDIWYRMRDHFHPDNYFRRHICGRFEEVILPAPEKCDS